MTPIVHELIRSQSQSLTRGLASARPFIDRGLAGMLPLLPRMASLVEQRVAELVGAVSAGENVPISPSSSTQASMQGAYLSLRHLLPRIAGEHDAWVGMYRALLEGVGGEHADGVAPMGLLEAHLHQVQSIVDELRRAAVASRAQL